MSSLVSCLNNTVSSWDFKKQWNFTESKILSDSLVKKGSLGDKVITRDPVAIVRCFPPPHTWISEIIHQE